MPQVHCPICRRQFDSESVDCMPFCSDRCRLIDLGTWLEEGYGLAQEPEDDDEPEGFSGS